MASGSNKKEYFRYAYIQQGQYAINPSTKDFAALRNAPEGVGRWMDRSAHVNMDEVLRNYGFEREPTHRLQFDIVDITDYMDEPRTLFVYERPDPSAPVTVKEVVEALAAHTQDEYKSGARNEKGRALLYILQGTDYAGYSDVKGGPRREYDPVTRAYTRIRPGAKIQTLIIPV